MSKGCLLIILLFSILGCDSTSFSRDYTSYTKQDSSLELPEKMVAGTLTLKIKDEDEDLDAVGSGVAVIDSWNNKLILTAMHVSIDLYPRDVYACSLGKSECMNIGDDFISYTDLRPDQDWAIYKVEKFPPGVHPVPLSKSLPRLGDEIWTTGTPWGRVPWISAGRIAWIFSGEHKYKNVLLLHGFAAEGCSGGGVFDSEGRLIGIISALIVGDRGPQENQILAVPIQSVWMLGSS